MELSEILAVGGAALLLFFVRIVGTALGTVRTLVMHRGMEVWTAVLGFGEIFVYVVGLGAVVNDLGNIAMLMGYCTGFSVGVVAGMRLDRRLALGHVTLRVISRTKPTEIVEVLRREGYGATLSWGEGKDGRVGIIESVLPSKHAPKATRLVHATDPTAFLVADEARSVMRGWLPGATSAFPALPVMDHSSAMVAQEPTEGEAKQAADEPFTPRERAAV